MVSQDDLGLTLYLSGQLHVHVAQFAAPATIASFVQSCIARSSLIVALYWKRESALFEGHAHNLLVSAIEKHDGDAAGELMKSHLVDLHTVLDLGNVSATGASMKDILGLLRSAVPDLQTFVQIAAFGSLGLRVRIRRSLNERRLQGT